MFSRGGCPDGEVGVNSIFLSRDCETRVYNKDSRVHMYPGNSQTFGQFSGWEIKMQHNVLDNLVVLEHYSNSMIYCVGFLDLFFLDRNPFFPFLRDLYFSLYLLLLLIKAKRPAAFLFLVFRHSEYIYSQEKRTMVINTETLMYGCTPICPTSYIITEDILTTC